MPAPVHHFKQGIELSAGIGKGIEAISQVKPEFLIIQRQTRKSLCLWAEFPLTLFSIICPKSEINSPILNRMKETAYQPVILIQVSEGPTAKTCDRNFVHCMPIESLTVFTQHPPDNVSVLDMLIAGRAYGWTTGKTRFSGVGEAERNIFGFHVFPFPALNIQSYADLTSGFGGIWFRE
jgi:hypothetical protein